MRHRRHARHEPVSIALGRGHHGVPAEIASSATDLRLRKDGAVPVASATNVPREVKFDGFRALTHIDGHHCTLVSRNGHVFTRGRNWRRRLRTRHGAAVRSSTGDICCPGPTSRSSTGSVVIRHRLHGRETPDRANRAPTLPAPRRQGTLGTRRVQVAPRCSRTPHSPSL